MSAWNGAQTQQLQQQQHPAVASPGQQYDAIVPTQQQQQQVAYPNEKAPEQQYYQQQQFQPHQQQPQQQQFQQQPIQQGAQVVMPTVPLEALNDQPAWISCPYCGRTTMTKVTKDGSTMQILASILCYCICICLVCVPQMAGWCENYSHFCSSCNQKVAFAPHDGPTAVFRPQQPQQGGPPVAINVNSQPPQQQQQQQQQGYYAPAGQDPSKNGAVVQQQAPPQYVQDHAQQQQGVQ